MSRDAVIRSNSADFFPVSLFSRPSAAPLRPLADSFRACFFPFFVFAPTRRSEAEEGDTASLLNEATALREWSVLLSFLSFFTFFSECAEHGFPFNRRVPGARFLLSPFSCLLFPPSSPFVFYKRQSRFLPSPLRLSCFPRPLLSSSIGRHLCFLFLKLFFPLRPLFFSPSRHCLDFLSISVSISLVVVSFVPPFSTIHCCEGHSRRDFSTAVASARALRFTAIPPAG